MPLLREPRDPDLFEAKENLRLIRELMERSTRHSTFSGVSGVFAGAVSIFGCVVTRWIGGRGLAPDAYAAAFLTIWASVVLMAIGADYFLTKRRAAAVGKRIMSRLGRQMFVASMPGLGSGVVLTLYFCIRGFCRRFFRFGRCVTGRCLRHRPILSKGSHAAWAGVPCRGNGHAAFVSPARPADDGADVWRFPYCLRRDYGPPGSVVGEQAMPETKEIPLRPPRAAAALEALEALDDTIHQKARLGIMSALLAYGEADFRLLKEALSLSDGNLSAHLAVLEERGYLEAKKEFVRRKPHTTYTPTETGRAAFQKYLLALECIVKAADLPAQSLEMASENTEEAR